MATLIAVYKSGGERGAICVGRCDAKCYQAQSPDCDCICGGKNHGAGLEQAVENTREQVEEWLQDYAKEKGLTDYKAEINRDLVDQLSLFSVSNFSQQVS